MLPAPLGDHLTFTLDVSTFFGACMQLEDLLHKVNIGPVGDVDHEVFSITMEVDSVASYVDPEVFLRVR